MELMPILGLLPHKLRAKDGAVGERADAPLNFSLFSVSEMSAASCALSFTLQHLTPPTKQGLPDSELGVKVGGQSPA